MSKIEQYFYGETVVHILVEEDAYSALHSTGSGANHQWWPFVFQTVEKCYQKPLKEKKRSSSPMGYHVLSHRHSVPCSALQFLVVDMLFHGVRKKFKLVAHLGFEPTEVFLICNKCSHKLLWTFLELCQANFERSSVIGLCHNLSQSHASEAKF